MYQDMKHPTQPLPDQKESCATVKTLEKSNKRVDTWLQQKFTTCEA
jgi:hypothetical protein